MSSSARKWFQNLQQWGWECPQKGEPFPPHMEKYSFTELSLKTPEKTLPSGKIHKGVGYVMLSCGSAKKRCSHLVVEVEVKVHVEEP